MSYRFNPFTPLLTAGLVLGLSFLTGCANKKPPEAPVVKNYAFWPVAPDEPRIQFLLSLNSSTDIAPARSSFEDTIYGKEQDSSVEVSKPYGVAMHNGAIYVTDVRGNGIIVLDIKNQQTRLMGAVGEGKVSKAVDISITPEGIKYVVDPVQSAIVVFDAKDRFVQNIPLPGMHPVSVCAFRDRLYVADSKGQCVHAMNRATGQEILKIGEPGGEDGKFIQPIKVICDKDGNVIVDDVMKCRVQKFSPDGALLMAFGEAGTTPGFLARPKHMALASDGVLYVVDAGFYNVQLFDEEGKIMMYFGSPGAHPGAMDLPAGITIEEKDMDLFKQYVHPAFQAERLIVVSNQFGSAKVSIYAQGHLKPGKTLADIANRAKVEIEIPKSATQPTTAPAVPDAGQPSPKVTP